MRAVIEHDLKRKLEDDEWSAFNIAFEHYWNSRWDNDSDFSAGDMYDSILRNLKEQNSRYFSTERELVQVIDILITYLMHVPKLILPDNTEWDPREEYIPAKMLNVHFKDTVAQLTSFNVLFAHQTMEGNSELEFTAKVEKEAAEAAGRKDGTVYILYYRSCDNRRVCPYRYTLTARVGWTKHIRVIMYWDAPTIDLTIADYARIAFTDINFFKNCILYEKVGLPF